jgi:hypothetical protein
MLKNNYPHVSEVFKSVQTFNKMFFCLCNGNQTETLIFTLTFSNSIDISTLFFINILKFKFLKLGEKHHPSAVKRLLIFLV